MAADHTAVQVVISAYGRVDIGQSSRKCLNTGSHEKAPIRCLFSRLATLNGVPRTRQLTVSAVVSFFYK